MWWAAAIGDYCAVGLGRGVHPVTSWHGTLGQLAAVRSSAARAVPQWPVGGMGPAVPHNLALHTCTNLSKTKGMKGGNECCSVSVGICIHAKPVLLAVFCVVQSSQY
jgi:hypothetical protein